MVDAAASPPRVLLVDDESRLTDLLRLELDVEGYAVDVASDGASALIKARQDPAPNLIVLDWNLPDFTGIDICQRIRSSGVTTPILMLTGHDDIADRVKALDAGVDDYLTKPFSIEELMARLRAMQRRAEFFSKEGRSGQPLLLEVGDLRLHTGTRDVRRGDREIQLSVKEYDLLHFLMRGRGRVLERAEIMRGVWGENFYGDDNLLDVYIRYLRQKIETEDQPTLIHTVRGVGFILRDEATR
ncbi:two-component system response regulator RR class I (RRI)-CheY [Synechococcus sp. RS9909]|uniref:response regulator transcription factor n=1 Tax=unclassified Synechococcus TaxID=2626047 RepID=UPI000068F711|nr:MULTISPECIES: response regulator transcription factor [unclassified Synechococcus]EAQ69546.1 two-component response regulator [Synechococcus sp. RS9917]QNI80184.1 two-component system response regulator RR class I (RRI)-CheY [Synechococcus sp. RS9909]